MSELPTRTYPSDRPDAPPPDTSVKVPHLVFALLFLGAAGAWALVEGGVITADRLTLLGPALLIGAGVVGLAASLAGSRNRSRRTRERAQAHRAHATDAETADPTDPTDSTDPTQEIR